MEAFDCDLAAATPVNALWPELVERLGLERSARAARQALDLQAMRGRPGTLPLLLVETCGVGLVERERLRAVTGLPVPQGEGVVLLFSRNRMLLQLLAVQS
jgi:hypothetical protein